MSASFLDLLEQIKCKIEEFLPILSKLQAERDEAATEAERLSKACGTIAEEKDEIEERAMILTGQRDEARAEQDRMADDFLDKRGLDKAESARFLSALTKIRHESKSGEAGFNVRIQEILLAVLGGES